MWVCDWAAVDKNLARLMNDHSVTCAALAIVPDAKLLSTCVNSGTPAVLWTRRKADANATRANLTPLLDGTLTELPARVHNARKQSASAEEHPGRHLALLWDNFDRLPPIPNDLVGPSDG